MVKFLANAGADLNAVDAKKYTPLHIAAVKVIKLALNLYCFTLLALLVDLLDVSSSYCILKKAS